LVRKGISLSEAVSVYRAGGFAASTIHDNIFFEGSFISLAFLVGASCHEEQREYYD